jgi:ceroid-lipofuscinosis MFS transporter 7
MTILKSMSALALIGFVDSISYMAVGPSLIFYVLQVGGNKEMYGLVMSAFSFASFLGKPVFGVWVDKGGNKFRIPYFCSFFVSIIGALMYFFANACQSASWALAFILIGRLLGGFGAANQALGYAYIASVIPQEGQTKTNTILSMTRIIGMATGPVVNVFLAKVDSTLTIGSFTMAIDPLNSVGLLLAIGNMLVVAYVFFVLGEPEQKPMLIPNLEAVGVKVDKRNAWHAVFCIEIMLPLIVLLVVNSSFQL